MENIQTAKSDQKVFRIYVEKRNRFNVDAKNMLEDLKENLHIAGLSALRLLNRYDIEGISEAVFEKASQTVFAQPNTDKIYLEEFSPGDNFRVFAMEFLPGQYDQREDSAAQILQVLSSGDRPAVSSAQLVCLEGDFSDEDFARIKSYLINPVEARLASLEKPESILMYSEIPSDIEAFAGFIDYDEPALKSFWETEGFAMNFNDLHHCQKYFRDVENRDPSVTELKVIDTYWSDHCRHTTFLTQLDKIEIEESRLTKPIAKALEDYQSARHEVYGERVSEKYISLMDIATMGMRLLKKQGKLADLDESEEINACSIKVPVEVSGKTEEWLIQFKNETHNHPTEIEPFGGASTCLGGAIRDPLSGRAYVYQAMRITGSGNPFVSVKDTVEGKLPTFQITKTAADGYAAYGNQIGLASGYLRELYDDGYVAKRMELGAVVAASPARNVVRETPAAGDVILLVGGKTGRDGCGGATGSSKAHTTESSEDCSAEVQKGCPPIERNIQRLFRKPEVSTLIKRCNDFGAGGVCVAIGELADGLEINLDNVKTKYDGLNGTELAISESQERMAVVIDKNNAEKFIAAAEAENLEATAVAVVTDTNRLVVHWRGNIIVDISRDFLNTNGVTQHASAFITAPNDYENYRAYVPSCLSVAPVEECFKTNLSRLKVASQNGLMRQFDATVGGNTVNLPLGGKYQRSPEEAMVAKIPLEQGFTDDATAMSFGFIPGISRWSPFHGSAFAVTQSLARLAAVGAPIDSARLTFQEYFESLRNDPARWGKPAAALLGAFTAQKGFGTPSIGGKDSMSGSFNDIDVPPTLVSFAISLTKASETGSSAFKKAASLVAFLPLPIDKDSYLPDYEKASELFNKVSALIRSGEILSASVVDEGGTAAAVSKMAFGNKIGFSFTQNIERTTLFAPLCGSFVVELKEGDLCLAGLDYALIGSTIEEQMVIIENTAIPLDALLESWKSTLEPIFPTEYDFEIQAVEATAAYKSRSTETPAIKKAKPRVFIPIFAGTNGEYETIKAFKNAGAEVNSFVFKNLTPDYVAQSFAAMILGIEHAEILALAGGMTLGDEPDGAGKLIAAILRNPAVAEAVSNLFENRKGLILGLGDGFNALLRTGLIIEGKFTDLDENAPAFVKNPLGRHVSTTAYTKVTSVLSPWHAGVNWSELYTQPISSGEGRFVAPAEAIERLAQNGQIASRFTDCEGKIAADDSIWNPNSSVFAVEALTSPCGRILGKMGLVERCGENLFRNVPGKKDMKIFESGVNYWK